MTAEHITDHDAPVWNAAIEKAIEEIEGRAKWGQVQCGSEALVGALRGLIRPELSAAEMDASGERLAAAIRAAHQAQVALRPFVAAYQKAADPIGDSDLYDEQPRSVSVTLGDCRRAVRAALAEAADDAAPIADWVAP